MAVHKGRSKPKVDDEELVKALIYCKHHDGELCNYCDFGRFAPHCSDVLADAAVDRIRELNKELAEAKKE